MLTSCNKLFQELCSVIVSKGDSISRRSGILRRIGRITFDSRSLTIRIRLTCQTALPSAKYINEIIIGFFGRKFSIVFRCCTIQMVLILFQNSLTIDPCDGIAVLDTSPERRIGSCAGDRCQFGLPVVESIGVFRRGILRRRIFRYTAVEHLHRHVCAVLGILESDGIFLRDGREDRQIVRAVLRHRF